MKPVPSLKLLAIDIDETLSSTEHAGRINIR